MSIPLVKVDQYTVTDLPAPACERDYIRVGRDVTFKPGDSTMHVAGYGHVSGGAAMDLVRALLAGYVLIEQDQAARR
jgi:hypothetical protein